jgi:hypothetical protein
MQQSAVEKTAYIYIHTHTHTYAYICICKRWPRGGEVERWRGGEVGAGMRDEAPPQNTTGLRF